tara:strand:- start:986 stop:1336 length:351 start_codon:yes stop_codon:yes gene_type:complete
MDTTEREELDTGIDPADLLTPHLDDFLAEIDPSTAEDEISKIMNSLLESGDCQLPIREVWEAATDAGLSTPDLLTWAESSDSCYVDYVNGLIRCATEPSAEEEAEEDGSDTDVQGT